MRREQQNLSIILNSNESSLHLQPTTYKTVRRDLAVRREQQNLSIIRNSSESRLTYNLQLKTYNPTKCLTS